MNITRAPTCSKRRLISRGASAPRPLPARTHDRGRNSVLCRNASHPAAGSSPSPASLAAPPTSPGRPRGFVSPAIPTPRGAIRPNPCDVILAKGRAGSTFFLHPSNRFFRKLISARCGVRLPPRQRRGQESCERRSCIQSRRGRGGSFLLYDARSKIFSKTLLRGCSSMCSTGPSDRGSTISRCQRR